MYIAFPSLPAASLPVDLAPEDLQEAVVPCSTPTLPCVVLGIPCQRLLTLEQPCAGKILGRGIMLRWVLLLNPPAALKSCLSWGGICKGDADGMGAIDNASHPGGAGSRPLTWRQDRDPTVLPLGSCQAVQNQLFLRRGKISGIFPCLPRLCLHDQRPGNLLPVAKLVKPEENTLGFCSVNLNKIKHPPDGSRERGMGRAQAGRAVAGDFLNCGAWFGDVASPW